MLRIIQEITVITLSALLVGLPIGLWITGYGDQIRALLF